MTMARSQLVDVDVTPYYHCCSRTVRRAFLCGEGFEHRKDWIEKRLEELAGIFAIDVCGFAILDNHLHVLTRLNPQTRDGWSDEEVVRRWGRLFPQRDPDGQPLEVTQAWVEMKLCDPSSVGTARQRLGTLGWFMKCLKEPLSRMANREDGVTGAFWEGRFKSIAILDEESLLATCAYIDLNPVAAGIAKVPEKSVHTSVHSRVEHCRHEGNLKALTNESPSQSQQDLESTHWLCPVEACRESRSGGRGMLRGLSLTGYLKILDWSSRLVRTGKARVGREVAALLDRLQIDAEGWQTTLCGLLCKTKLIGSFFGQPPQLAAIAAAKGQKFVKTLPGRATQLCTC